jgi:hypothetical protein
MVTTRGLVTGVRPPALPGPVLGGGLRPERGAGPLNWAVRGVQLRSAGMHDGHMLKTPQTALRMARDLGNSGISTTTDDPVKHVPQAPGAGDRRRHDHRPGARNFTLVHLVANTIMNVTTQDDQLAVFANVAEP